MNNNSNGIDNHQHQYQQSQRFTSRNLRSSPPPPASSVESNSLCTNNSIHLWTTPVPPGAPRSKHIPCDPILDREHFSKRDNYPTTFMRNRSREKRECGGGNSGNHSPFSYFIHFSIIVLVLCLCGFSIYIIWTDYMGVKSFIISTESFVNPTRYEFPPIMICNRAIFNVDDHPYSKDSLIAALRNASRSPANLTALNLLAVYNENYFYASYSSQFALFHSFKLEQFVLLCKFYNSPIVCSQLFKPVFIPLLGMCYKSEISESWPISPGPLLGADIYFYFDSRQTSPIFNKGILVLLGDQWSSEKAMSLTPGKSITLSTQLVEYIQDKSFDSHPCRELNPSEDAQTNAVPNTMGYSVESCRNRCMNDLWLSAFGCFAHAGFASIDDEKCMDTIEQRRLTIEASTMGHSTLTPPLRRKYASCMLTCNPPCNYKTYEFTKSEAPMNSDANYVSNLLHKASTFGKSNWRRTNSSKHVTIKTPAVDNSKDIAHLKVHLDSTARKKFVKYQAVHSAVRFCADIFAVCSCGFSITCFCFHLYRLLAPRRSNTEILAQNDIYGNTDF